MKELCLAGACVLALMGPAVAETVKAFTLDVGGQKIELDPGETVEITLPDGAKTSATLIRNEFARYSGDYFSFSHPSNISVAVAPLGDGIKQYMTASALGTFVIVQEYSTLNPNFLQQMMLNQLTEDGVKNGAEVTQEKTTRSLADGKELVGLTAVESSRVETADYEIVVHGDDKRGVLIVTRVDRENAEADGALIDTFWDSLKIGY